MLVLSIATCHQIKTFWERRPLQTLDLNSHIPVKMHIQDTALAGINQGAAKNRISAAVADHCGEVDAENVSIPMQDRRLPWNLGAQSQRLPPNLLTHRITQRRLIRDPQHAVPEPVGDGTVLHPVYELFHLFRSYRFRFLWTLRFPSSVGVIETGVSFLPSVELNHQDISSPSRSTLDPGSCRTGASFGSR
jgi:hypothetical protein